MKVFLWISGIILFLFGLLLTVATKAGFVFAGIGVLVIIMAIKWNKGKKEKVSVKVDSSKKPQSDRKVGFKEIDIAGPYYHRKEIKKLIKEYGEDGSCKISANLIEEGPDSEFPGAIRIECDDMLVGYVPKKLIHEIKPLLGRISYADAKLYYEEDEDDPEEVEVSGKLILLYDELS